MTEIKTRPNDAAVDAFLTNIENDEQRHDSQQLAEMMQSATGEPPRMWGSSIVGFDSILYKSKSQPAYDWFSIGFSPRKGKLTLYLTGDLHRFDDQLARLGKFKQGQGCLWIKRLSDVDQEVLRELIDRAAEENRRMGALIA
jgi:hypothetical protein